MDERDDKGRFKKGKKKSGPRNGGRRKIPAYMTDGKYLPLTHEQVSRIIGRYSNASVETLKRYSRDKSIKAMDAMVINMILGAVEKQCERRSEWLLARSVGKVKEPERNINFNITHLPPNEAIQLGREAVRFLEAEYDLPNDDAELE